MLDNCCYRAFDEGFDEGQEELREILSTRIKGWINMLRKVECPSDNCFDKLVWVVDDMVKLVGEPEDERSDE